MNNLSSMMDAGVLRNDSKRYLQLGSVELLTRQEDHQGRACVYVILEHAPVPEKVKEPKVPRSTKVARKVTA